MELDYINLRKYGPTKVKIELTLEEIDELLSAYNNSVGEFYSRDEEWAKVELLENKICKQILKQTGIAILKE